MQQKKFVTNIAFLIVLNLLIKPFWPLGIEPAVQNAVGNASYGEYAISQRNTQTWTEKFIIRERN